MFCVKWDGYFTLAVTSSFRHVRPSPSTAWTAPCRLLQAAPVASRFAAGLRQPLRSGRRRQSSGVPLRREPALRTTRLRWGKSAAFQTYRPRTKPGYCLRAGPLLRRFASSSPCKSRRWRHGAGQPIHREGRRAISRASPLMSRVMPLRAVSVCAAVLRHPRSARLGSPAGSASTPQASGGASPRPESFLVPVERAFARLLCALRRSQFHATRFGKFGEGLLIYLFPYWVCIRIRNPEFPSFGV